MSSSLLSRAFAAIDIVEATVNGEPVSPEKIVVEQSKSASIIPLAMRNVRVLVPARDGRELTVRLVLDEPLLAPLQVGSPVGTASVSFGDRTVASVPLVSDRVVEAKGFKAWLRGVAG
jgi:D-alanyl-D-alanine carboxypeptidase